MRIVLLTCYEVGVLKYGQTVNKENFSNLLEHSQLLAMLRLEQSSGWEVLGISSSRRISAQMFK